VEGPVEDVLLLIYRKLDVANRRDAVERARSLRLVGPRSGLDVRR